ncbi:Rieske (2Fe-2S) protein [Azorhizobium doebereinerae]|uniref:Rieske (2Fe-2S) protein n=1 Tax=Azorhizobium doebereinerae TaxID=281091 RepID=UPI00042A67A0|nr:Rieske 2Fe-2S domain-containing protein [Azorhizobium doebereinerae]
MPELFAICSTYEVDDGGARGFVLARLDETGATKPWPIIVTRKSNAFFGFENVCPHQGTRLDTVPGEFLDEEGNFLTCGKHHAQFDLDTGHCFIGPCQGKDLTPVKLVIDDGDVCLVDIALAEEDGLDIDEPDTFPEVMITGD